MNGRAYQFVLDTGAQKKVPEGPRVLEAECFLRHGGGCGAGESEHISVNVVKDLSPFLGSIACLSTRSRREAVFGSALIVKPDWKLGINPALHGSITIDYPIRSVRTGSQPQFDKS